MISRLGRQIWPGQNRSSHRTSGRGSGLPAQHRTDANRARKPDFGAGLEPVVRNPLIPRDPSRDRAPFLPSITYDFGPSELLGQFFLIANAEVQKRGLTLVASTLDDLVAVNKANSDTWLPIVSIFDSEQNDISESESYCILGLDENGAVAATQAVRLITLRDTNFADEVRSMRIFYSDLERMAPGEACTITAPAADRITGRIAYSGGVWYRPDFRKRGLTAIMPRIARAYAFTRWATNNTVTLMAEGIVDGGTAQRVGYPHVEWEARFHNNALEGPRFAFLHMDDAEMLDDLRGFVARFGNSEIDAVVQQRTA